MNELIYGVAYYPEYEPEYRTEKDLQMMKKAGFNTVRIAESTWSTWEPREGEYDFSILTDTLDACEKEGMQVIIGTPTYAVPSWLVKKDPAVMVETKAGAALYGPRQMMDITNATYREAAERLIRHLMEVCRPYSCVIGFQLDNETKHYGTASTNVQAAFKEHLIKKFGTVEEMNRAFGLPYWSNSIGTWDDLPDVRGTINGSLAAEFEAFQRTLAADFLKWQRGIVDEYRRPDQFVTHNFDFEWKCTPVAPGGASYGVQPDICHQEACEAVTLCGADIYHPTQDDLTGAEIAFGGDSIRNLKDQPYLILETQAQAFRYWTPYPGQLRQQALSHLASGACGVEYWHWHSIHNSFETYWKGVLSHDMEENAVYLECMQISKDFHTLAPHLEGFRKQNRVAIVVDNRALTALRQFPIGDGDEVSYNDVVRMYYDTLYRRNIECDVVDVARLPEVIGRYRMLVTPALYTAEDETIRLLRGFVQDGGTLISSFKSFFADENVKVRHERQPYHMTDVFGMYYQEFTRPGKAALRGRPVRTWAELLIPNGAEVCEHYEHRYWGEYSAVTYNSWGKGYAVYVGCLCDESVLADILENTARRTGISVTDADISFPVILRSGVNGEGKRIHFLFNYSDKPVTMHWMYREGTDLLTGDVILRADRIRLEDWGTIVLEEK